MAQQFNQDFYPTDYNTDPNALHQSGGNAQQNVDYYNQQQGGYDQQQQGYGQQQQQGWTDQTSQGYDMSSPGGYVEQPMMYSQG